MSSNFTVLDLPEVDVYNEEEEIRSSGDGKYPNEQFDENDKELYSEITEYDENNCNDQEEHIDNMNNEMHPKVVHAKEMFFQVKSSKETDDQGNNFMNPDVYIDYINNEIPSEVSVVKEDDFRNQGKTLLMTDEKGNNYKNQEGSLDYMKNEIESRNSTKITFRERDNVNENINEQQDSTKPIDLSKKKKTFHVTEVNASVLKATFRKLLQRIENTNPKMSKEMNKDLLRWFGVLMVLGGVLILILELASIFLNCPNNFYVGLWTSIVLLFTGVLQLRLFYNFGIASNMYKCITIASIIISFIILVIGLISSVISCILFNVKYCFEISVLLIFSSSLNVVTSLGSVIHLWKNT